jgi:hypothetical protein
MSLVKGFLLSRSSRRAIAETSKGIINRLGRPSLSKIPSQLFDTAMARHFLSSMRLPSIG